MASLGRQQSDGRSTAMTALAYSSLPKRSVAPILGRIERRLMAAIEICRTPALGGHVDQVRPTGSRTASSCRLDRRQRDHRQHSRPDRSVLMANLLLTVILAGYDRSS